MNNSDSTILFEKDENEKISFRKEKVIVVEGKDDMYFFKSLLEKSKIADIQIFYFKGKGDFKNKFQYILKISGFNKVKKIVAILDADKSYQNTKQSIMTNINKTFKASDDPLIFSSSNPNVAYFIMPNNKDKGMMETLCIASQKNSPAMKQVGRFIGEVNSDDMIKKKPKNKDKAEAQAYLSIMPNIAYGMSYGIVKNYWDLDYPDFKKLITFLKSI